jgi:hypothetical protein
MTSRAIQASGCAALLFASIFACGMTGCGGTSSTITPPNPPPTPANIAGNWELAASSPPGATTSIAVYLTSNAGSVSGIAEGPAPVDNVCTANGCCGTPIGIFHNVALTGTVDANGNLKLGTATGGNPAFAMTGTASGSNLSNGSFTLTGTCSAQGTITGTEYAPLDGTYAGTLTSQATGQSYGVTTTLDQSNVPNSSGYLNLTGAMSVSGYPCISSGSTPISSTFLGNEFNAGMNPSPNATLSWSGILSPDGKAIAIDYGFTLSGSSCNDDYGTGTLTLQ